MENYNLVYVNVHEIHVYLIYFSIMDVMNFIHKVYFIYDNNNLDNLTFRFDIYYKIRKNYMNRIKDVLDFSSMLMNTY